MSSSSSDQTSAAPRSDFDLELQELARQATAVTGELREEGREEGCDAEAPVPSASGPEFREGLERILGEFRRLEEMETANRQLFDTLHSELRQYRDGFLLESLRLPVIRDLLSLLDDMESVRCQVGALLPGAPGGVGARARGEVARVLERASQNLENTLHFLREILLRMDVEEVGEGTGSFDRAIHRQVGVEPVSDPTEEGRVASVVRAGFVWRSRTLRPAEVIVRKVSAAPAPAAG